MVHLKFPDFWNQHMVAQLKSHVCEKGHAGYSQYDREDTESQGVLR